MQSLHRGNLDTVKTQQQTKTYFVNRAVHLEMTSLDACINGLQRFISKRGQMA